MYFQNWIGLHFCRRHYGSDFNHCNVTISKVTEFSEIMQTNGHKAVKSHYIRYQWKALHVLYHAQFARYGRLLVTLHFRCGKGAPLLNALVRGEPPKFRIGKFCDRN